MRPDARAFHLSEALMIQSVRVFVRVYRGLTPILASNLYMPHNTLSSLSLPLLLLLLCPYCSSFLVRQEPSCSQAPLFTNVLLTSFSQAGLHSHKCESEQLNPVDVTMQTAPVTLPAAVIAATLMASPSRRR